MSTLRRIHYSISMQRSNRACLRALGDPAYDGAHVLLSGIVVGISPQQKEKDAFLTLGTACLCELLPQQPMTMLELQMMEQQAWIFMFQFQFRLIR